MVLRSKNLKYSGAAALPLILALCLVVIGTAALLPERKVVEEEYIAPPEPVTILLVGDIMMDRGIRSVVNKYFEGDYNALFTNTDYIKEADIAFANLEGPVAEESTTRSGSRFAFRMAPESLSALAATGFDIVSFSNNHVGDYSTKAFLETLTHLKQNSLLYAGAGENLSEASSPTIIEVRGMKIGFLALTDVGPDWLQAKEQSPGIIIASNPQLPEIIASAKEKVDILAVSFHWGNEYSPVSVRQKEIAHKAIDAGADIIIGHHPHVMQAVEYYQGGLILYSLGNFIFDQYFSEHTMRGMVATISIDPQTKAFSLLQEVSPLSKQYIPQALVPFDETMLVTKTFTP